MKFAGCEMIAFGLESGNQEVLNAAKKNLKIEKIVEAIKLTKKYGIKSIGHFIVGLPNSNTQKDLETINFAKKIGVDFAQFYTATPYYGSELYTIAKDNNWINDNKGDVQRNPFLSYPDYSHHQIQSMRRLAYKKFYFNFKRLISLLTYKRFAKNPLNWLRLIKSAPRFLNWAEITNGKE
jgi:radical SAM superfamily enzyme YgiQ (UPF0313 family)